MRRALLLGLLLSGCRKEATPAELLLSQVKQALADRDARLRSYHLVAVTKEGEAQATHAFFFRSPNQLRAVVAAPTPLEWSFDGTRLYQLQSEAKTFSTFELKLPPAKASIFLHSTFSPFVPEGFRAPLMPAKGVSATRVTHPMGPEAVELKLSPGEGVTVTWVLRWPTADFLERRTQAGAGTGELKVEAEHCDAALKLCVPRRAAQFVDGQRQVTTELTTLELNLELPAEAFTPAVPAGWTRETRQVVED